MPFFTIGMNKPVTIILSIVLGLVVIVSAFYVVELVSSHHRSTSTSTPQPVPVATAQPIPTGSQPVSQTTVLSEFPSDLPRPGSMAISGAYQGIQNSVSHTT